MTACCLVLALLISHAPPWQTGLAVRYAPGVMRAVARNRGIEPAPCMIAYTHARDEDMGVTWLEVEGTRTGVRLRCLIVDMPKAKDRPGLIWRGVLVELDAESGQAVCGATWSGKARECPVRVRVVSAVVGRALKVREWRQ